MVGVYEGFQVRLKKLQTGDRAGRKKLFARLNLSESRLPELPCVGRKKMLAKKILSEVNL